MRFNKLLDKLGIKFEELIESELNWIAKHENNWLIRKLVSTEVITQVKIINLNDGDMIKLGDSWYLTSEITDFYIYGKKVTWNNEIKCHESISCHFIDEIEGCTCCEYQSACIGMRRNKGRESIIFLSIQDMIDKELRDRDKCIYLIKKMKRDYGKYILPK